MASAIFVLHFLVVAILIDKTSACDIWGSINYNEDGPGTCICANGFSGTTCNLIDGRETTVSGLECSNFEFVCDSSSDMSTAAGPIARAAVCSMLVTPSSSVDLEYLFSLIDCAKSKSSYGIATGEYSLPNTIVRGLSNFHNTHLTTSPIMAAVVAIMTEYTIFGFDNLNSTASFELASDSSTLEANSVQAYLTANLLLDQRCVLPCPCGEIRHPKTGAGETGDVLGECVALPTEAHPMLLWEVYVAYARCASLGSTRLKKRSLAAPDVFLTRSLVCLGHTRNIGDDQELVDRWRRLRMFFKKAAGTEESSPHVANLRLKLSQLGSHFNNVFNDVTMVPPFEASWYQFDKVQDYISYLYDVVEELQNEEIITLLQQEATTIEGLLRNINNDNNKKALSTLIANAFGIVMEQYEKRNERFVQESKGGIAILQQILSQSIEQMTGLSQSMETIFDTLKVNLDVLMTENYKLLQVGRDFAVVQLMNDIGRQQQLKIQEMQRVVFEILVVVSNLFQGLNLAADPVTMVENFEGAAETSLKQAQLVVEKLNEIDEIGYKYDTRMQVLLSEIRLQDFALAISFERLIDTSARIYAILRQVVQEQQNLVKFITRALNGSEESGVQFSATIWGVLAEEVRILAQFDTALCRPSYLPPGLLGQIEEIRNGYSSRLQSVDLNETNDTLFANLESRRTSNGAGKCQTSFVSALDDKHPVNHAVSEISIDMLDVPNTEREKQIKEDYILQLDLVNLKCGEVLGLFTAVTSYGEQIHSLANKIASTIQRIRLESSKLILRTSSEHEQDAKRQVVENVLGTTSRFVTDLASSSDVVTYFNLAIEAFQASWSEEQLFDLIQTASLRLIDLCASLAFAQPGSQEKFEKLCEPIAIDDFDFNPEIVREIAQKLQSTVDELKGLSDSYNWDEVAGFNFVQDRVDTLNITEMIGGVEVLSKDNFKDEFFFDLTDPLAASTGVPSGPYLCRQDNVGISGIGIFFTDENNNVLGPRNVGLDTQTVQVEISLIGISVKTSGSQRFLFDSPTLNGIEFSYSLANENGDCQQAGNSAIFGSQLCVVNVVDVTRHGSVMHSPYRQWRVKVKSGNEYLDQAKKVWIYIRFTATFNPNSECYVYPPLDVPWASRFGVSINGTDPLEDPRDDLEWEYILIGSLVAGLAVVCFTLFVVRKRQRRERVEKDNEVTLAVPLSTENPMFKIAKDYNVEENSTP